MKKIIKEKIAHGRWFSLSGKLLKFIIFAGLLGLAVYLTIYAFRKESILLGAAVIGVLLIDWFFVINPWYRKHKGDIGPYIVFRILSPLAMWIVSRIPSMMLFILGVVVSALFIVNALAPTTPKDAMWVLLFIAFIAFILFAWAAFALWRRFTKE